MSKPLAPEVKAENARVRRVTRIQTLREKRLTLREIGERVKLTGPRVYKILKRSGKEHTFYKTPRMSFTGEPSITVSGKGLFTVADTLA